jgi:hypothetical protein
MRIRHDLGVVARCRFVYYIGKGPVVRSSVSGGYPQRVVPPRLTVSFDDPSRYVMRPWLEVNGNRMCFTRADPQSDVWMTEVSGAR